MALKVGRQLEAKGLYLVTAESCTGGWIAKAITDVAGSSHWFERGFVTYSDAAKTDQLGVPEDLLEREGAVSEAVARAMAEGAAAHSDAQLAVAVTGIAGPEGGSDEKPVGTVWFGWVTPAGVDTAMHQFSGDRDAVRRQTVITVLEGVIERAGE